MGDITRIQAEALADFLVLVRPDWNKGSIVRACGEAKNMGDAFEVAVAAINAAGDSKNRTPSVIPMTGKHWAKPSAEAKAKAAWTPPPPKNQTCGTCYMGYEQCRRMWEGDHEFVSLVELKRRISPIPPDDYRPQLPRPTFMKGRPVEDVELP